jgi:hypothetical protein
VPTASTYGFASTLGGSLAANNMTAAAFWPVLQAQDGSYYGTDDDGNMVHAAANGTPMWSVPGDYPQTATADGGVISTNGTIFDVNLNITGQMTLPTYSWYGFTYSAPVSRLAPSANMLQVDLLRTSDGNVSRNGSSFNLPDDPYSLRLVPTSDDGKQGQALREITYTLTKLDGKSTPRGNWYVTEHQTNFGVTSSGDGMSGGLDEDDKQFPDTIGCQNPFFGCSPTNTIQTFTISTRTGPCRPPSYRDPQTTHCTTQGGTIVVHSPRGHEYGKLGIYFDSSHVLINGFYNWSED